MKKWVALLAVLILLGYGVVKMKPNNVYEKPLDIDYQVPKPTLPKDGPTIHISKDQIHEGNLLLVNKDYPVPSGGTAAEAVRLTPNSKLIDGFAVLDNTIKLSPSLAQKFSAMVRSAENDGVAHFIISSGYRDNKEQDQLFKQMGPDYALPAGYSEHNLGLSLDIGSTQDEMDRAPEGKWLKSNAWKYGFILRYPKDKTEITGILYEPWHFRYVGLPHSAIMQEKNFVLEEYLDFLREQKTVTTRIDQRSYEITYYPISANTTIRLPTNGSYEISGDNRNGVIVTVYF